MKIEMGESLVYSWLRHVKGCHIVQTNWKASPNWELINSELITELRAKWESTFPDAMKEAVFKNRATSQILSQGEIDVLGISLANTERFVYAVDIAFHKKGLNYKGKVESVAKVVKKSLRTVMSLLGYGIAQSGEIIFASPEISKPIYSELSPVIQQCNEVLKERQLNFTIRVIANGDFEEKILRPTLVVGKSVNDTSELFLRSMQLSWMFAQDKCTSKRPSKPRGDGGRSETIIGGSNLVPNISSAGLEELKIGIIARTIFRELLESGAIPPDEIERLQEADYSKTTLHLYYPCLVKATASFESVRYYTRDGALKIHDEMYHLCSQWNETSRHPLLEYMAKFL